MSRKKVNIIILGQFKNKPLFLKSLKEFSAIREYIDQIIMVVWEEDYIAYKEIESVTEKIEIEVIVRKQPQFTKNIFYQMKALEIGLKSIRDTSLPVFKTRTDLWIRKKEFLEILELDRRINIDNSVLEEKIWIPWFEITKPYYMADECFLSSYRDALKLLNYKNIFDDEYDIDAGISHVRRFINLENLDDKKIKKWLTMFGKSGHGTVKRKKIMLLNLAIKEYNEYLLHYYKFLKYGFRVGLKSNDYIEFRIWSRPRKTLKNNIKKDFSIKNSFDRISGAIYSYNEEPIEKYYEQIKGGIKNKISMDQKYYLIKRDRLFSSSRMDLVILRYNLIVRAIERIFR